MGSMIDGVWHKTDSDRSAADGRFLRSTTSFRDSVTADGSSGFEAEPGRYHLYVSHACPWAHRTMVLRALRKLENVISVSVVDPFMSDDGWHFSDGPGCIPDTVSGARYLREIYRLAKDDFTGRVTVPVLWDKREKTIVNNESAEIIRMLNTAFNAWGDGEPDLFPAALRDEIEAINETIYEHVNNGVYKTGFARSQEAYEEAFDALFATLDGLEARLGRQRYLLGARITEADWRLFPTLIRFDAVYVGHFKCNRQRIEDYPALSNYLRDLYQQPGIADTVDMTHIKRHYYESQESVNPSRVVAKGPVLDFTRPHDRNRFSLPEAQAAAQ
ncbi:MAG: glutathione S-transferase family protein [Rhodospirillales bacterium]|nr:glutathione S-transferase family protein [Rhodospirillales bacterium]MDE0381315.1 glutathione S-transferase family protein [Rhodospirillales bacterium]